MWIIGIAVYLALLIPVLLFLRCARIFEERYQKLEGTPYSHPDPLALPQIPEACAPEPRPSLDPAFGAWKAGRPASSSGHVRRFVRA